MADERDWEKLSIEVGKVFTPAVPVDQERLFAGRIEQLRQVLDAVNQKGQHVIVFGERGVGKTSLANIISTKITAPSLVSVKVNCDSVDTYSSIWKKVFDEISLVRKIPRPGFNQLDRTEAIDIASEFDGDISPDNVRRTLASLSNQFLVIIVMDEFDRITRSEVRAAIADTIKALSDFAISATIVLVGVADSVDSLVAEHQSVERALVQVRMPRMSVTELTHIIDNGLKILGMSIEDSAKNEIALLSKGLPHYTHLLSLFSAREALDQKSMQVQVSHVKSAIAKALQKAQQTIQSLYHKATSSPRKDNLFARVLLACALARTDDLGYFAAADLRIPLSRIMGMDYDIGSYSRHLYAFCEQDRGPVLQKIGKKHRFRFRFLNPMMQPYIIMAGTAMGFLSAEKLQEVKNEH